MQQLSLFGESVEIPKEKGTHAMACHICGATFYAKSKRAKYCSKDCRSEAATRRRREKAAAEEAQTPAQLNVIRFPNGADLLDAENDAELLMKIIENQQLQIGNQQQLIELLQTTLEALRSEVHRREPIREQRPRRVEFDDDNLPGIEVRDDNSGDSGQNFLNSLMALQD